jgi:hypothetical protein
MGGAEIAKDTLPQKQLPLSMGLGWAPGLAFGASDMFGFNVCKDWLQWGKALCRVNDA